MVTMCINDKWIQSQEETGYHCPVFGETCEVVDVRYFKEERRTVGDIVEVEIEGVYYKLQYYSGWFHSSNFATIPRQSAEQINQESKEAIVNIETSLV